MPPWAARNNPMSFCAYGGSIKGEIAKDVRGNENTLYFLNVLRTGPASILRLYNMTSSSNCLAFVGKV